MQADKLNKLLQNAYVNQNGSICVRVGRKILCVTLQTFRELLRPWLRNGQTNGCGLSTNNFKDKIK